MQIRFFIIFHIFTVFMSYSSGIYAGEINNINKNNKIEYVAPEFKDILNKPYIYKKNEKADISDNSNLLVNKNKVANESAMDLFKKQYEQRHRAMKHNDFVNDPISEYLKLNPHMSKIIFQEEETKEAKKEISSDIRKRIEDAKERNKKNRRKMLIRKTHNKHKYGYHDPNDIVPRSGQRN